MTTNSANNKVDKIKKTANTKGITSRNLLINTAAQMFAKNGFTKTNMRELADACSMKAGSIFYHFKGKEQILFEVMKQTIEYLLDNLKVTYDHSATPEQRLRTMVKMELGMYLFEMSSHGFVMIHEWHSLSPEWQEQLLEMRAKYENYWQETLDDCYQQEIIKADPKIVRRLLNGAFSWVIYWYQAEGEYSFEQLIDQVMIMIVKDQVKIL